MDRAALSRDSHQAVLLSASSKPFVQKAPAMLLALLLLSLTLIAHMNKTRALMAQTTKNILLCATTKDIASNNIASHLIVKDGYFKELSAGVWKCKGEACSDVYLWLQNDSLLKLDYCDRLFCDHIGIDSDKIDEVLFLSKHTAASGKPSLTVHPIGIAYQTDNERSGGIPGRNSPPSSRIGAIYRQLLDRIGAYPTLEGFEVTLEATHHGPHLDVPTAFLEIGSTADFWGNAEAGKLWAELLLSHLGLVEGEPANEAAEAPCVATSQGIIVMGVGGGHYTPGMNDIARMEGGGLFIGHTLATYALASHLDGSAATEVPGGWKQIIRETVTSCRASDPGREVVLFIDKKAFPAAHRNLITSFVTDELGLRYFYSKTDVKNLVQRV